MNHMTAFTLADGPAIKAAGIAAIKQPTAMYFQQQTEAFTCQDKTGAIQHGQPGDYASYDPVTGNVFMLRKAMYDAGYTALPTTITAPASST
jgi:hypothetical protein